MFRWFSWQDYNGLVREGDELLKRRDWSGAAARYSAVLNARPKTFPALFGRAWCLYQLNQFNEALADAQAALKIKGLIGPITSAKLLFMAAACQFELGHKLEAIELIDRAIVVHPGADALVLRALIRAHLGDRQGMRSDLTDARRYSPESHGVLFLLARHYACSPHDGERDGPLALQFARLLCEQTKWNDWKVTSVYAAALAECGDFDEAARWAQKSFEQAPDGEKAQREERVEQYRKRQPYRDDLFARTVSLRGSVARPVIPR